MLWNAKGFRRKQSHHTFFHYYTETGKKTSVWTKTSHGRTGADVNKGRLKSMARQCKLTPDEFRDLVECPLSRADYEQHLHSSGKV